MNDSKKTITKPALVYFDESSPYPPKETLSSVFDADEVNQFKQFLKERENVAMDNRCPGCGAGSVRSGDAVDVLENQRLLNEKLASGSTATRVDEWWFVYGDWHRSLDEAFEQYHYKSIEYAEKIAEGHRKDGHKAEVLHLVVNKMTEGESK